jgi:geranylgeranyl diphosphate synthase type I
MRDDVLGVFGDPKETGKPAGDDLREGKRTVLIATALDRATKTQATVVRTHLGDPDLDADGLEALRSVICDTGALAFVEQQIQTRLDDALAAAACPLIEPVAQRFLIDLAYAATSRSV